MPKIDRPHSAPVTRQTSENSSEGDRASLPEQLKDVCSKDLGHLRRENARIRVRAIPLLTDFRNALKEIQTKAERKGKIVQDVYLGFTDQGMYIGRQPNFVAGRRLEEARTHLATLLTTQDKDMNPLKDIDVGAKGKVSIVDFDNKLKLAIEALEKLAESNDKELKELSHMKKTSSKDANNTTDRPPPDLLHHSNPNT